MLVGDFDYELPDELIAQDPAVRGSSRLLCLDERGPARDGSIGDLPGLLSPGDLLVVNDTEVIPARLFGRRRLTGGRVEILLAEPSEDDSRVWHVLLRPGRRARPGTVIDLSADVTAEILGRGRDGRFVARFSAPVDQFLAELGHVPLPPYIKRPDKVEDRRRYQTVFAERPGAIAAPTAGLHFTRQLLDEIRHAGVSVERVTLHVGLGTFKPVKSLLVHEHRMDVERFEIPSATENAIRNTQQRGGRVVAVGTTVVRALEGAAAGGELRAGSGSTDLFIYPGFRFAVVDVLMTNFHLPRSTLLMLVCAFAGRDRVLAAYREAVEAGYRFYSYGDAMVVSRAERSDEGS